MSISRKPLGEWTEEELDGLLGLRESLFLEFKGDLAVDKRQAQQGEKDRWHQGGKLGREARKDIVKEVVAFANAQGGDLFLGVAETKTDEGNVAATIAPLPRCAALAEALSDCLADSIEQRLLNASVVPIPMKDDGSGIVAVRVGASLDAPHRSTFDNIFYRRRWDRSEPMTVSEIRELSRARDRQEENIRRLVIGGAQRLQDDLEAIFPSQFLSVATAITLIEHDSFEIKRDMFSTIDCNYEVPRYISAPSGDRRRTLGGVRYISETCDGGKSILDVLEKGAVFGAFYLPDRSHNDRDTFAAAWAEASLVYLFQSFSTLISTSIERRAAFSITVRVPRGDIWATAPAPGGVSRVFEVPQRIPNHEPREFSTAEDPADVAGIAYKDFCDMIGVEAVRLSDQ